jgi:LysM repeat protein
MTNPSERHERGVVPFPGLTPSRLHGGAVPIDDSSKEPSRISRSLLATMPIVLAGTLAISAVGGTGTVDTGMKRPPKGGSDTADLGRQVKDAFSKASRTTSEPELIQASPIVAESVPTTYTVKGGDSVSSIASHYGLATASVLALNGLSWKSLIFPGQVLKLTSASAAAPKPAPQTTASISSSGKYTIVSGDTITGIARKLGVSIQALLDTNGLTTASIIYSGRTLIVPGKSVAPAPAPVVAAPAPSAPIQPVVSVTPLAPSASTTYKIVAGDTVTSIAKKFGVSVQAVLSANGMTASSIIYAGRTLSIPGAGSTTASTTTATTVAQVGTAVTPLSPEMQANASTIIAVGKQLGVPSYGIIVALAAAAQESGLRNLSGGDLDSLGLFQQRPSAGWGTPAQIMNTTYASELFYGGPKNPNVGKTRGLLDIPGWQAMSVTQAAQAVQISAYPTAYAKWETSARAWFAQLG